MSGSQSEMNWYMCSYIECRATGLRRAASAGRRAGAQPAVQPHPASAAISPAMQLSSNSAQAPISHASGKESLANTHNAAPTLPERQTALSDSSLSVQSGASIDWLAVSTASTASKHQGAASRAGKSELNAEPSDMALKQAEPGRHLPAGELFTHDVISQQPLAIYRTGSSVGSVYPSSACGELSKH